MLIPLAWMILSSLKSFPEVMADPPVMLPDSPQWSNYDTVLRVFEFDRFLWNSLFVTTAVVLGTLVSATLAGYAFAFLRVRRKALIFGILLTQLMLPGQVAAIPLFLGFVEIGWINTFLPLILPAWLGQNVFALFLMRQFQRTLPFSYIEAARIDGASELQIIWNIIVPASWPVLMAITVFSFLWSWNDLFNPLLYLHDERLYTMPIGLLYFISEASAVNGGGAQQVPWHLVMALATVMVAPIILIFFIAQKHFVQSVAASGVKG
jgi:ABC-type glycerol-3-phosphate transport system permease component